MPKTSGQHSGRRTFLKAFSSVLPLGMSPAFFHRLQELSADGDRLKLGLHLGSVQELLVSDPMKILGTLNQMGIRYLELQDVSLLNKLQPVLKGAGFEVPSSFFPSPYITNNWNPAASMGMKIPANRDFKSVVDQAVKYDLRYLVMPGIFPQDRGGLDVYKRLATKLNEVGKLCQQAGIQLAYHHYAYEFQPMENTTPMAVMLETWEEDLIQLEVNTFWLSLTGLEIVPFLEKYSLFLGPLHLADKSAQAPQTYRAFTLPPDTQQTLGEGVINFPEILESNISLQIPYFFIHLEDISDPLAAIRSSVSYMKKIM